MSEAATDAKLFGLGDAKFGEACGDGLLDVDAFDGNARFTAIHEAAPDGGARRYVEIGVCEDDHGVFAAQFENRWDQVFGAGFGNSLAGGDAAGEEDFVGTGFDYRGADFASALQDLHQVMRKLGLLDQLAYQQAAPGRQFGGLQQHRVACGERGDHLRHGNREWVVPGRNNRDDAERTEFHPAGFRLHGEVVMRHALGAQPARGLTR